MAVLKNKTQGKYTIVSQTIMRDQNLSLTERGMLATLLSLPDNWHFTIAGLCQILPDGKEKISRTLNSLIDKGYVTRTQARGQRGQFDSTDLEVHETSIRLSPPPDRSRKKDEEIKCTSAFVPYPENPDAVNWDTDNPQAEKSTQYTTNISNTNTFITDKVCRTDTLTDSEYENLVLEFGKTVVDHQIRRIADNNYRGCNNYATIRQWCQERKNRPVQYQGTSHKTNAFNDFPQRTDYDFDAIERMLLSR